MGGYVTVDVTPTCCRSGRRTHDIETRSPNRGPATSGTCSCGVRRREPHEQSRVLARHSRRAALSSSHEVHAPTDRHHRTRGRPARGPLSGVGHCQLGPDRRGREDQPHRSPRTLLRGRGSDRNRTTVAQRSLRHSRRGRGWVDCACCLAARCARFLKPKDSQLFDSVAAIS